MARKVTRSSEVASDQCRSSRTRHTSCSSRQLEDEVLHRLEHAATVCVVRAGWANVGSSEPSTAARDPRMSLHPVGADRGPQVADSPAATPYGRAPPARSTPCPVATIAPPILSSPASSATSRDFPIPGSPAMTTTAGAPSRARPAAARSAVSSSSRPTNCRLRTAAMTPSWRRAAAASAGPAGERQAGPRRGHAVVVRAGKIRHRRAWATGSAVAST